MEKKVSIKDVANLAGVSVSTVSRALNNGTYVSLNTRKRIMDAVEQLNFRPNYFAKALKVGVSKIIALILPNINNPVYALITQGVESIARMKGYNVILCNTDENINTELEHISLLKDRNVDGFIFATARSDTHHIIDNLVAAGIPTVDVMRYSLGANAVTVDNFKIGYDATTYLIQRGHRKISIFTGDDNIISYKLRTDGYRQALAEHGIECSENNIISSRVEDTAALRRTITDAIRNRTVPDAIFCVNWPRAVSVYGAAKELGLKIPDDLSVFGVDDLEFIPFLDPPLTTIAQPFYEMGRKAAEVLLQELAQTETSSATRSFVQIIMPTEIIERDSIAVKKSSSTFDLP